MRNVQITSSLAKTNPNRPHAVLHVGIDKNVEGKDVLCIMTECDGEGNAIDLTFDDVDVLVSVLRTLVPAESSVDRRLTNLIAMAPGLIQQVQSIVNQNKPEEPAKSNGDQEADEWWRTVATELRRERDEANAKLAEMESEQ